MNKIILKVLFVILLLISPCEATVEFNGSTDYLCGNDSGLPSSDPMTVAVWIRPTSVTGERSVAGHLERVGTDTGWTLDTVGDELQFVTRGVKAYVTTTFTIVTNEWQFITAVLGVDDDVDFYHYRPSTGTWTTENDAHTGSMNAPTADADFHVGARPESEVNLCSGSHGRFFAGKVSDIYIWDTDLSSAQVHLVGDSHLKRFQQSARSNLVMLMLLDEFPDGLVLNGDVYSSFIGGTIAQEQGAPVARAEEFLSYPPY